MRQRLSAAQVSELAELLDDAPKRAGLVDEVLQAAAEGRGMTLVLTHLNEVQAEHVAISRSPERHGGDGPLISPYR